MPSQIPNYRPATGSHACANCGAFENGFCRMFEQDVKPYYVCDDWVNEEEWEKHRADELYHEVSQFLQVEQEKKEKVTKARKNLFELGTLIEGKKGVNHFLQLEDEFEESNLHPGTHLTPTQEKAKFFKEANLPLGVYISVSPDSFGDVDANIELEDNGDSEIYLKNQEQGKYYKFIGSPESFSESFRKVTRNDNRIKWTLQAVQTCALFGLYMEADDVFDALKDAISKKEIEDIRFYYHSALQKIDDILEKELDWPYAHIEIRRKVDAKDIPLSDLYIILKHASAVSKFRKEKLKKHIKGTYQFVHDSIDTFIESIAQNPSTTQQKPLSLDFVITNTPYDDLINYISSYDVDSQNGVPFIEELPDRKLVQVSYIESNIDDSLHDVFQTLKQLSKYDEEIFEQAQNYKIAPELSDEGENVLKEGYWGAVKKGGDFVDSLPDKFFNRLEKLSHDSFEFHSDFVTSIRNFESDIDLKRAKKIAQDAEKGKDGDLEEIEEKMEETFEKLEKTSNIYNVSTPERVSIRRNDITWQKVYNLLENLHFANSLLGTMEALESDGKSILEDMQSIKNIASYETYNMPMYKLKTDGSYELIATSEEEDVEFHNNLDFQAAYVKINRQEGGPYHFSIEVYEDIDEETGKFEYKKFILNNSSVKTVGKKLKEA